jgi:RNA polymerase sigma factor (sigma-70 family)
MNQAVSNQQLYTDCQQTGSIAQQQAYELLWRELYRIAYAMLLQQRDPDALASDCTQKALIKIHHNIVHCQEPERFRSWAAQIVRRTVIDTLRQPAFARQSELSETHATIAVDAPPEPNELHAFLMHAIEKGPLSDRSRRVVLGRFFAEQPDEILAKQEQALIGDEILPSHIQVTRAKNLAKLRQQPNLLEQLRMFMER